MRHGDFRKEKQFAEIKEVKDLEHNNENVLRIWCRMYPNVFSFQIRTHKPITMYGIGKPRNMIATIDLTIEEVEEILKYMKEEVSE